MTTDKALEAAELKPCPFCGARRAGMGASDAHDEEDGIGKFTVMCEGCGASVSLYFDTEAEAIAAWNTRPALPAPEGVPVAVSALQNGEEVDRSRVPEDVAGLLERLLALVARDEQMAARANFKGNAKYPAHPSIAATREWHEQAVDTLKRTADLITSLAREREGAEYLIWSNEHQAWWRANRRGYTANIGNAGIYTRAEAVKIANDAREGWGANTPPPEIAVPVADLPAAIRSLGEG